MAWSFWSSASPNEGAKSEPQQQQPTTPPQPPPSSEPSQQEQPTTTQPSDFETAFPHLASPPPSSTPATPHDPHFPTTMSCRAAFDNAFYCSSFGGHFNDIYRYGQLRSCSEQWADWRFCMRIKTFSAEAKAEAIQDRYREKEKKLLDGPNSEDVWRRRGVGEEVERPFGRERVDREE
ncbi:hypothetical protein DM02DRAFT_203261 [Periconia macrospinosa]|uniref:Early meiotic induction protein 1 n=1 Tax=Periconia macrospinosa TaxID=97972 RepID=A0A2V1E0U2_9PLEO|nr:hypothetical protein DM02DRAFT_203261 [Periconia macrospinosa]